MSRPPCDWCGGPIAPVARRDAVTCSKRCRQARHRFRRGVLGAGDRDVCPRPDPLVDARQLAELAEVEGPARLAYADPPYPGNSSRYYADHPDFAGEVDHQAILEQLVGFDGWALSTSARALPEVLGWCPAGVRVASWHRGVRPTRSRLPLTSWEPVIYRPARPVPAGTLDSFQFIPRPRTTDPARVVGAKPATFAGWLFDLLGADPADEFTDLFPGSGGISRAWQVWAEHEGAVVRWPAQMDLPQCETTF